MALQDILNFAKVCVDYLRGYLRCEDALRLLPTIDLQLPLLSSGGVVARYGQKLKDVPLWFKVTFLLRLTFLILYAIRWVMILFIQNEWLLIYLGDFTLFVPGSKGYLIMAYSFWSIHAAAIGIQAYLWNDDDIIFGWIRPMLITTRKLEPSDSKLDTHQALLYWIRVGLCRGAIKYSTWAAQTLETVQYLYVCISLMDQSLFIKYYLHQIFIYLLWHYYTCFNLVTIWFMFHLTCYYLVLRFDAITGKAKSLVQNEAMYSKPQLSRLLNELLKEHSEVCKLVKNANKYWEVNTLIIHIFYIMIICSWMYLLTYETIDMAIKANILILTIYSFIALTFFSLSAAWLASKGQKFYRVGQQIAQLNLDRRTRIKLSACLKRCSYIGFSPFSMFRITYATYYEALVVVVSNYILVVDLALKAQNL